MNTLYRFFDANEQLLYVGLTINPGRRMEKHRATKPWWEEVARVTLEQHSDIATLRAAERAAITAEKPLYNVRMNGSGRSTPRRPEPETKPDGIVGRWFHSYRTIEEGEKISEHAKRRGNTIREWQGQIIARDGDIFIAQLYSWWDGMATNEAIVEPEDMKLWRFFPNNQEMQIADGCIEDFGPDRGGVCGSPCTHVIRDWCGMGSIYRCWRCIKFYAGKPEEL